MSGEARLRREVVRILKPLHAQPVENMVKVGCPDVEYHGGWIEVKRTREWPARDDTIVKLDHDLTPGQRIWLRRRCAVGGTAWVLIQIAHDYLLFSGDVASARVGYSTRQELLDSAAHRCRGLKNLRGKLIEWVS